MVEQTCNSSPSEAETGGLLKIWGHPEPGSEYQASKVADIETRYWDTFWNKTKNWNSSDDVQRKEFLCNIGRNASENSIIEDSIGVPPKTKNDVPHDPAIPLPGVCVCMKNHHTTESILMFIEVLFITVKAWIQPRYVSLNAWILGTCINSIQPQRKRKWHHLQQNG